MRELIANFPEQLLEALEVTKKYSPQVQQNEIRNVLVTGLGGSGIGANLVSLTAGAALKVPLAINKGYGIPNWVDGHTLFIASSFSGNTEETVDCLRQAMNRGAKAICITSGGELAELASVHGLGIIILPRKNDIPRANLGYSIVALLSVLHGQGLIDSSYQGDVRKAVALIGDNMKDMQSVAERLATELHGKLPIIYADVHMFAVAKRFQQQVNENAKQFCHVNVFPEMNHNELVGWEHPVEILGRSAVVYLHSQFDHERVNLRWKLLRPVFETQAKSITEIWGKGETRLIESLYLLHLLDWCSLSLAEKNNTDPVDIIKIDQLKKALSDAK